MLLECHGLRNQYWPSGPGADLCLNNGEIAGVSGASGSGKTLLLRAIADLDPSFGEISLQGQARAVFSGPQWRSRVVYVAAEPAWWAPTMAEHFAEPPAQQALASLHLSPKLLRQTPIELSTGERQRLALLRALAHTPLVLLLDEPTSALDRESTQAIEHHVTSYVGEHGAAALWVSHDTRQLRRVCGDVLYQLSDGALGALADPDDQVLQS